MVLFSLRLLFVVVVVWGVCLFGGCSLMRFMSVSVVCVCMRECGFCCVCVCSFLYPVFGGEPIELFLVPASDPRLV